MLHGTGYFRLEMVGKNNDVVYSQTISLQNNQEAGTGKITGLTNPFVSTLTFTYTSSDNSTNNLSIYNAAGTRIFERKISMQKGANPVSFALDRNMASGLYLLELSNDKERTVTKLIKL